MHRRQGRLAVSPHLCVLHSSGDTADVSQAMLAVIPAAVRQVNAPNETHGLVNDYDLLMVSPQVDRRGHMVWVPHHLHSHTRTHETQ